MNKKKNGRRIALLGKQHGVVVLIILLMLGIGLASALVTSLSKAKPRLENDAQTAAALAQARDALIGYAVSHSARPGLLPFPDRSADGNYDGISDCSPSTITNALLLGKLPRRGENVPCMGPLGSLNFAEVDGSGEDPWYGVSRNLLRAPSSSFNIPLVLNGASNWLTVRDVSGAVLSNRVAFVLFAPGAPLGTQNRAGAAVARNYLDDYRVGVTNYRNWDNDRDFIVAADTVTTPAANNQFNDKLIYVTRDEYRVAIGGRVAGELKSRLKAFYDANGDYPFAAPSTAGECVASATIGYVAIKDDAPNDCLASGGAAVSLSSLPWFAEWQSYVLYERTGSAAATLSIFGKDYALTP
ncbi:MAG: hypothetical protein ACR2FI_05630 [Burkholderiales bacterium]|nr:hypothetical protein [Burkholderiales bacterium]MDQ3196740.1 hypothetical protein [Pseudomonadota bacterium]